MDEETKTFLKTLLVGVADRAGIAAATWLVAEKIIPSVQEATAERVIASAIVGLAAFAWVWWRSHGSAIAKAKLAELEAKVSDPGPAPAPAPVAAPAPAPAAPASPAPTPASK